MSSFIADATRAAAATRLRRLSALPGPPALPLLGNAFDLKPERSHLVLEAWARQYGPLAVYHLGRKPVLLVSDATLAQAVMRSRPQHFRRMAALDAAFRDIIGPSLFTAEGDELKRLRRLWMRALGAQKLESFFPTLARITARLHGRWLTHARSGAPVDVRNDCLLFMVDVIGSLALGSDIDVLGGHDRVFHQNVQRIFPRMIHRLVSPVPYWRWLKLPAERALEHGMQELRQSFRDAIARAQDTPERPSFLHALLEVRDDDGRGLSQDEIVANGIVMLLGGEDSGAYTLAWCIHHLCERPDLMQRLRAEADAVLGAGCVPQCYADTERLELAGAVVLETLRVRPPVPVHFLEASCDTELGGVLVPRGTPVQLVARPAAERAEGQRALAFEPERWLDASGTARARAGQFPFGAGPRVCPGRALALLELRLALAMLAKSFRLERVGSPSDVTEVDRVILTPQGLYVRFHEGASESSPASLGSVQTPRF